MNELFHHVCPFCGTRFTDTDADAPFESLCANCNTSERGMEQKRLYSQLYRARLAGLPATLTLLQWLHTIQDFNGLCAYCQIRPFEVMDHFIPIDAGGGTTVANCVPACQQCNLNKGADNPDTNQLDLIPNTVRERVRHYLSTRIVDEGFPFSSEWEDNY